MKKLILYVLLCITSIGVLFAQSLESTIETTGNITVSYGENKGAPYNFNIEAPTLTRSWNLSIAEFNGRALFLDSGEEWDANGYVWIPTNNIALYSGIYYVVSISFLDGNNKIIKTDATRFFIPIMMQSNKSPLVFFDGDTVQISKYLYRDEDTKAIFDVIVNKANSEFADRRILIRGHASYITSSKEEQQKEQIGLLELSRKRALKVLSNLVASGVDSTRIFYEAFGGSVGISTEEEQRWKNRRVEVVFVRDIDELTEEGKDIVMETIDNNQALPIKAPTQKKVSIMIENTNAEPWPDLPILGQGQLQANQMLAFVLYNTPTRDKTYINYIKRIIMYYINEANRERVNYDIAFAQMLHETNYLRYTGQVRREQYNFAGIGTVSNENEGIWFATEPIGVRAHIQHLKGYATRQPLRSDLVDPRYPILERMDLLGSSPLVSTLTGRWASDPKYSKRILIMLRRMYNYANALMESNQ